MKILYIITQADGGGAQKYVLQMAKHFGGEVAAGTENGKLFDEADRIGVKSYGLKHLKRNISLWHDLTAWYEIYKLVKKVKPDIVHANSTKAGLHASIGGKLAGAKVVFTAHGFRYLEPLSPLSKLFYKCIEKFASVFRDYIIAVSNLDRDSAVKDGIISSSKISTIHNGIPLLNFLPKDEARKVLGLPEDKKIVGIIANDYETKGLDIVEALKPIPGTLTAIIGKVSKSKQSNENISYLGYKENASQYLKAFDVFIIPSKKEGFPYVALEAMQAGLPVVATKVGGIPEALGDAGILVAPNDALALEEARDNILRDEKMAKELSEKALQRSKLFTEEKMFEETKKIYEKLKAQP